MLTSIACIHRQALYSARDLTIAPMLLAPASSFGSVLTPPSLEPSPTLLKAIEARHNPSQLLAIRNALCGRGITLIQGPPGTGKTNTILGMLSVLLSSSGSAELGKQPNPNSTTNIFEPAAERTAQQTKRHLIAAAPWMQTVAVTHSPGGIMRAGVPAKAPSSRRSAADEAARLPPHPFPKAEDTDVCVQLGRMARESPPKHVLVCAPSNAATDEIVSRLLQSGMLDAGGLPYVPLVVRVGPNVKDNLQAVAAHSRNTLVWSNTGGKGQRGRATPRVAAKVGTH